jgi:hypothetical protein
MTSLRQLAANRRNLTKSTNPTTEEGKSGPAAMPCAGLTADTPGLSTGRNILRLPLSLLRLILFLTAVDLTLAQI